MGNFLGIFVRSSILNVNTFFQRTSPEKIFNRKGEEGNLSLETFSVRYISREGMDFPWKGVFQALFEKRPKIKLKNRFFFK